MICRQPDLKEIKEKVWFLKVSLFYLVEYWYHVVLVSYAYKDRPNIVLENSTFLQFYGVMQYFSQKFLKMSASCIRVCFSAFLQSNALL